MEPVLGRHQTRHSVAWRAHPAVFFPDLSKRFFLFSPSFLSISRSSLFFLYYFIYTKIYIKTYIYITMPKAAIIKTVYSILFNHEKL